MGESISSWLEGESSNSFFEFQISISDDEAKVLEPVELVAVKSYYATGIVLVIIYFGGAFFAVVSDAGSEQPLLDSKFPDVSNKGRGYMVNGYGEGAAGWPGLRKVSVWQTTAAMTAEMEARLGKEGAAQVTGAIGTLATASAVDAMERAVESFNAEAKDDEPSDVAPAKDEPISSQGSEDKSSSSEAKGEQQPASSSSQAASSNVASPGGRDHGGGLGDSERMNRQSLGAFHRLQPMASVESQLAKLRGSLNEGGAAPWESDGKPRSLGKLGSPFGKGLDFKKGPGPGGL
jgi:hypothetical protein